MLEPGFRPAVLAVRAFDALGPRDPGARWPFGWPSSRPTVRSFISRPACCRPAIRRRRATPSTSSASSSSFSGRAAAGACTSTRPADEVARLAGSLSRHAAGQFDSNFVGERVFDHPLTIVRTPELPPERSVTKPLGRHLDGYRIGFDLGGSDRKVAAVDRRPRRLQRRDGLGPVPQAGSAVSLRRHHGLAAQGRRAPAARRRHRRQRRRRLRQQPGPRWFAVSRRRAGSLRCARQEHVPRRAQGLERRAARGRERRRGDGARRLDVARRERDSRHRARHQHGGRLCHARGQHHVVAERAGVRADRLQPGRRGRRVVGRLRRRLAVLLAAGRRPPDARRRHRRARPISACPSD